MARPEERSQECGGNEKVGRTAVCFEVECAHTLGAAPGFRRVPEQHVADFMPDGKPASVRVVQSVDADQPVFRAQQSGNLIRDIVKEDDAKTEQAGDMVDRDRGAKRPCRGFPLCECG